MKFTKSYWNVLERIDVTMKKITGFMTAFLMMAVLAFSLAACGSTSSVQESSTPDPSSQGALQTSEADASEPTSTTGGETLVVYFSASGNTERVAKEIGAAAGADLFAIEPE